MESIPPIDNYAEIDMAMDQMFYKCHEENIPIITHCTPSGAEVAMDSGLNANPIYWEKVLNKYKKLRINFAHFGGIDNMIENKPHSSEENHKIDEHKKWARTIAELMEKFDYVYADVSHHNIMDKETRKEFLRKLKRLIE